MYRSRPYARRPRKYVRKGKKGVRVSKPLRRAMTQVAKRVISRRAEDKTSGVKVEENVAHNFPIGNGDVKGLLPMIPSGTYSQDRIGDRITPKRLVVKGVIALNPEQGWDSQNDIYARVLVLSQKDVKTQAGLASGVDTSNLLRPGIAPGSVETAFDGTTQSLMWPVNTDKFRVYLDKQFKFSISKADSVETMLAHSHKWNYTFTKKNLPASLTFDEGNGDYPNNFAPFVAIGFAYSDGSTPDTVQTKFITNTFAQLYWEDM